MGQARRRGNRDERIAQAQADPASREVERTVDRWVVVRW